MKSIRKNKRPASPAVAALLALVLPCACRSAEIEAEPIVPDEFLVALAGTEPGGSRAVESEYETRVREAGPTEREAIEREMLWILASPDSTFAAKQFACRVLRRVGGEPSVPVLAQLLSDERFAHPARYALQGIGSPAVNEALREALDGLSGELAVGVVDTIGERGDREAVPQLEKRLADPDPIVVRAALEALGRIGGARAADVLAGAQVDESLGVARIDARLSCARRMLAEGDRAAALAIYREVSDGAVPTPSRVAAIRGMVRAEPERAVETIAFLLASPDPDLRDAGVGLIVRLPDEVELGALAARLDGFDDAAFALALGALAARGEEAAAPAATEALAGEAEALRIAGLEALGRIGTADHVADIAPLCAEEGAVGAAARTSLERLSAPGADAAIAAELERDVSDAGREALASCLVARRSPGAVPILLRLAESGEPRTRAASIRGLEELASEAELPAMIELLASIEDEAERRAMESALRATCERAGSRGAALDLLVAAAGSEVAAVRLSTLRVLGALPSERTLPPLVGGAADPERTVREAAVRALAGWPDAAPVEVLQRCSLEEEDDAVRLVALEGYLRLAAAAGAAPGEIEASFRGGFEAARNAEERQRVIECAGRTEQLWAVGFLDSFRDDAAVGALAARSFEDLCTVLARRATHAAIGCAVTLQDPPVERYSAGAPGSLADGKWGSESHTDGRWLGFDEKDLVAVIDLGEVIGVEDVRVGFLSGQRSWIFPPSRVELFLSEDGENFSPLETFELEPPGRNQASAPADVFARFEEKRARYLKVRAAHFGILPKWHPGSGEPSWLFVDEIAVNARYEP